MFDGARRETAVRYGLLRENSWFCAATSIVRMWDSDRLTGGAAWWGRVCGRSEGGRRSSYGASPFTVACAGSVVFSGLPDAIVCYVEEKKNEAAVTLNALTSMLLDTICLYILPSHQTGGV